MNKLNRSYAIGDDRTDFGLTLGQNQDLSLALRVERGMSQIAKGFSCF